MTIQNDPEAKERLDRFFIQVKKLQALENYCRSGRLNHEPYVQLLKQCLARGWLGDDEEKFIDRLIERYQMDWRTWSTKISSVKKRMAEMEMETVPARQTKYCAALLQKELGI